jgi:CRP/FNR family cyclic AMP-dependent transcriptional regulator
MTDRLLAEMPLFADLSESEWRQIASRAVTRTFPKNAIILNEGDRTDSLYLLLSGKVKVFSSDDEGKEVVLNVLEAPNYFGELALLDDEPRSAYIMTLERCSLSMITKHDFMGYLTSYPPIAIHLLKDLAHRLRREIDSVKSLALMDVYGRVAKVMLELAQQQDGRLMTQRITNKEIAGRVGASREMVGRILKDLKQGGYISVEHGKIIINEKLPAKW